jgi:hypothetical protein
VRLLSVRIPLIDDVKKPADQLSNVKSRASKQKPAPFCSFSLFLLLTFVYLLLLFYLILTRQDKLPPVSSAYLPSDLVVRQDVRHAK